jgi:hypothetical protein
MKNWRCSKACAALARRPETLARRPRIGGADRGVKPRGARELVDDVAVPGDAEPAQPVEDGLDRGVGRALAVGVLDAQQHLAPEAAGIEPVEEGRAAPADMQEAGRRRGEAGDDA